MTVQPVIQLWGGEGGSGKSYCLLDEFISIWLAGGTCVTNLEVHWDKVKAWALEKHGKVLQDSQFRQLPREVEKLRRLHELVPDGTFGNVVVLGLDEAHDIFNAKDWAKLHKENPQLLSYVTHLRHHHVRAILMSQHVDNIEGQFRKVSKVRRTHTNMQELCFPGCAWLKLPWPWPHTLRTTYRGEGRSLSIQRVELVRRDPWMFDLYNSFSSSLWVENNTEKVEKIQLETVKKKVIPMKQWACFLLIVACLAGWGWSRVKQSVFLKKEVSSSGEASPPVASGGRLLTPVSSLARHEVLPVLRFRGFVSGFGVVQLRTDRGSFEVGDFTEWGRVVSVSQRAVVVADTAGRHVTLRVDDWIESLPAPVNSALRSASVLSSSSVVSQDTGPVYMGSSEEEKRSHIYPDLAIQQQKTMYVPAAFASPSPGVVSPLERRFAAHGLTP